MLLTAREVAHRLSNELSVPISFVESLQESDDLPAPLRPLVQQAAEGLEQAVQDIAQLQRVVRVATRETPVGPALDLDRSGQELEG